MDTNVTEKRPKKVVSRFELAASRMADAWLRAGRVTVSREGLRIARDGLEQDGWVVRDLGCGLVELAGKRGGPVAGDELRSARSARDAASGPRALTSGSRSVCPNRIGGCS